MYPMVLVVWEDARTLDAPWMEKGTWEYKPYLVSQIGYLLLDAPEGIILTQADAPEHVGAPDQIPRGMIRSITFLTQM